MNPTFHHVHSVEITPSRSQPPGDKPSLFNLTLRYRPEGEPERFRCVHVPDALQPVLQAGSDVAGVFIETLEARSLAQRILSGHPDFAVLSVTTQSGQQIAAVPVPFRHAWRIGNLGGYLALAAGAATLVLTPHAIMGALAVVLGSHCLRTTWRVPHPPFPSFHGPQ